MNSKKNECRFEIFYKPDKSILNFIFDVTNKQRWSHDYIIPNSFLVYRFYFVFDIEITSFGFLKIIQFLWKLFPVSCATFSSQVKVVPLMFLERLRTIRISTAIWFSTRPVKWKYYRESYIIDFHQFFRQNPIQC